MLNTNLNTTKVRTSAGVGAELNYAVRKLPPQTEKKECLRRL